MLYLVRWNSLLKNSYIKIIKYMKINNILKINFLFVLLSMLACQSLEDTYEDYAGDGKIKYVGMCNSFEVTAGWKRFIFTWDTSDDSNIKSVEIHWKNDITSGVYKLAADQKRFETETGFENLPYQFDCYAIDAKGNKSNPLVKYSRPFTQDHEAVVSFPHVVNKYYFLGDEENGHNLILFFDDYNKSIKSTIISYYEKGNNQLQNFIVDKDILLGKYRVISNVDINKAVYVNRVATVEGCVDEIEFTPIMLDPNLLSFHFDFAQQIQNKYGQDATQLDFVRNCTELEIDYSLKSMIDILYFSNLKKLTLGGNRFMVNSVGNSMKLSELDDINASVFALTQAFEKRGVEVVIHNNHFGIQSSLPFAKIMGNPTLPILNYLDSNTWTVVSSSKESSGDVDPAHPEYILDDNSATLWAPLPVQTAIRTHEIIIDMQSEQTINGFKVTQADLNNIIHEYYPDIIRVQLSDLGDTWQEATSQVYMTLGINYGESTIIRFFTPKTARYIKVILTDKLSGRNNTCLGDFMVF